MSFNTVAGPFPKQDEIDLSKPLGLMLESQNILSCEQVHQSGRVQAEMIAIRSRIEQGAVPLETALAILGQDRNGKADISQYTRKDSDERSALLGSLSIDEAQIKIGEETVNQAMKARSNVNEGHNLAVPAIGFIHMDLHGKDIVNLGKLKQGTLLAQRAIDAVHAVHRMEKGQHNAEKGAARGFKLWGDESPELANTVNICQQLHSMEIEGAISVPRELITQIDQSFQAASAIFKEAGYPDLAKKAENIRRDRIVGQSTLTSNSAHPSPNPSNRDEPGL